MVFDREEDQSTQRLITYNYIHCKEPFAHFVKQKNLYKLLIGNISYTGNSNAVLCLSKKYIKEDLIFLSTIFKGTKNL